MTLIVCKKIDDKIFIHSDAVLTFVDKNGKISATTPEIPAILKSVIINHLVCISYSGNVELAKESLTECLKDENKLNTSNIVKILLEVSKKYIPNPNNLNDKTNRTQFAYCLLKKDPVIGLITNGKIYDYTDKLLCLGSKDAVNHFKENFTTLSETISEEQALHKAFEEIIKNPEFPTIGYLHVAVKPIKGQLKSKVGNEMPIFEYQLHLSIETQGLTSGTPNEKGECNLLLNENSKPRGISCFISKHPEYFAIAFHFLFENTGILFCPQLNLNAINYKLLEGESFVSNSKEFLNKIKEKYHIPMQGFVHVKDTEIQFLDTQDRDSAGNVKPIHFIGIRNNE